MREQLDDTAAMQLAIRASQQALAAGNMPFGAALLSQTGQLLHVAGNNQVTSGDFTGHAELVLLREASMRLGREALRGTTVFASGEPCAMCSGALFWAGVRRVVYAVPADAMHALLGGDRLPARCAEVLAGASPPVRIDGPLLAEAATAVLRDAAARSAR